MGPTTWTEDGCHIAVFGDIHGRIALMYTLAARWQQETDLVLRALIQVGDMGAFPDHDKLDRATKQHAKRDPDELAYKLYCQVSEESQRVLDRPEAPVTYFIRGNHEDFDYLDGFNTPSAIDPWGTIWYIPDGQWVELPFEHTLLPDDNAETFTIAGFGGIAPPSVERGRGKQARKTFRKLRQRAQRDAKFFRPEDIPFAFQGAPPIDILMTHSGPHAPSFPQGSEGLASLNERSAASWHFFGHHHAVVGPAKAPGGGRLVGLDHLDFTKEGVLQDASWGILTLYQDDREPSFVFATHETMPWLKTITRHTYRAYLPG